MIWVGRQTDLHWFDRLVMHRLYRFYRLCLRLCPNLIRRRKVAHVKERQIGGWRHKQLICHVQANGICRSKPPSFHGF